MYLDPGSTCGSTCVSVLTSSDVWTGSTLLYRGSLPNYMFQMYGEYPHLTDDPHNNLRYTRCTGTHRYIRHRCACVITMIFHSSLSSSDMQFQQRGKTKVKKGTIYVWVWQAFLPRDRCMLEFGFLSHLDEVFSSFPFVRAHHWQLCDVPLVCQTCAPHWHVPTSTY